MLFAFADNIVRYDQVNSRPLTNHLLSNSSHLQLYCLHFPTWLYDKLNLLPSPNQQFSERYFTSATVLLAFADDTLRQGQFPSLNQPFGERYFTSATVLFAFADETLREGNFHPLTNHSLSDTSLLLLYGLLLPTSLYDKVHSPPLTNNLLSDTSPCYCIFC